MTQALSIEELATGLTRRGTPLSAESGLFIVLEAVEAMGDKPVWLTPEGIRIGIDGAVALAPDLDEVSVVEAMASALDTLDVVLLPPPAGAMALARKVQSGEVEALQVFTSELEALLVPLNKGAARRMLGRLVREHLRAAGLPDRNDALEDEGGHAGDDAVATFPDGTPRLAGVHAEPPRSNEDLTLGMDDGSAPPRRGAPAGVGIVAVLFAALALVAAGMFLYHRLQSAARASGDVGLTDPSASTLAHR